MSYTYSIPTPYLLYPRLSSMTAPSHELTAAGHRHHNSQHHMLLMSYEAP